MVHSRSGSFGGVSVARGGRWRCRAAATARGRGGRSGAPPRPGAGLAGGLDEPRLERDDAVAEGGRPRPRARRRTRRPAATGRARRQLRHAAHALQVVVGVEPRAARGAARADQARAARTSAASAGACRAARRRRRSCTWAWSRPHVNSSSRMSAPPSSAAYFSSASRCWRESLSRHLHAQPHEQVAALVVRSRRPAAPRPLTREHAAVAGAGGHLDADPLAAGRRHLDLRSERGLGEASPGRRPGSRRRAARRATRATR